MHRVVGLPCAPTCAAAEQLLLLRLRLLQSQLVRGQRGASRAAADTRQRRWRSPTCFSTCCSCCWLCIISMVLLLLLLEG